MAEYPDFIRQVRERVINSKGTGLRLRDCWRGLTKLGTQPYNLIYLDYPEVGKVISAVDEDNRWKSFEVKVDAINSVCIFVRYFP